MKNQCIQAGTLATLTVFVLFLTPAAHAQPAPPPLEMGREQAQHMIEQRLHELDRHQQQLSRAMEMLEAGKPLQEVRKVIEASAPRAMTLKPASEERVLEVLKRMNPELYQRIQKVREEHPQRAKQLLKRIQSERRIQEMAALLEHDPKAFQARAEQLATERQAMQAAMRFVDASAKGDEDAARQARSEARAFVAQLVDRRFTQQQQSFQRAEERLNRVRAELETHQADPDPVIDARLEALLRRAMAQGMRKDNPRKRMAPNASTPRRVRPGNRRPNRN